MASAASLSDPTARVHKGFHVSLWVVQILLAALFGMAGVMKTTTPIAELITKLPWAGAIPEALVRFIGASELAAAFGLILPSATRIRPALTPLAAAGLALVMALAFVFHVARGETQALPINLVLGGLAAFVAWGRAKKAPISARA